MDAWSWINAYKDYMNVTGAEKALAEKIRLELDPEGKQSEIDDTGCLWVQRNNRSVAVSAMMDVPGYLVLQKYTDKRILIYTKFKPEDRGNAFTAIAPDGKAVKVRRDKEPDSLYYIKQKEYGIGTALKELEVFTKTDGEYAGRNITRYALLYVLRELSLGGANCLFASQGFSNAPVEYNHCVRSKTKEMILLGALENPGEIPLALVRNGKVFSDPALVKKAEKCGFTPILSEAAITKAHFCADSGAKVLTLALPYRANDAGERIITEESLNRFLEAIRKMIG